MPVGARMAGRVEEDSGIDRLRLRLLAKRLPRVRGARSWWPYADPFEVAVSAVLVQQTRWPGVEKAMAALRSNGLLTAQALARAAPRRLERILRPTGFYRQKTRAIQGIARIVVERFGGNIANALRQDTAALRRELQSWPGVGEETADAILLFGAGRPVFVVDAYARRLMRRYGASHAPDPPYAQTAAAWAALLGTRAPAFQSTHAAIVELCKSHCTVIPVCSGCPLERSCPKVAVQA